MRRIAAVCNPVVVGHVNARTRQGRAVIRSRRLRRSAPTSEAVRSLSSRRIHIPRRRVGTLLLLSANGFVILDNPKSLFAAQNVVPLITKSKVNDTISAALNAISAKLDTATLGELVKEVVVDKKDPAVVAKEFLTKNGLG